MEYSKNSKCRNALINVLEQIRGYTIEEYLVSPLDPAISIPNNRLRYYLIAKRDDPLRATRVHDLKKTLNGETCNKSSLPYLSAYLNESNNSNKELFVPEEYLKSCKDFRFGTD